MEVSLIVATSADGFIAQDPSVPSTAWTSKEDAAWFAQKTKEIGICIMGKNTFETIGRPLPGRLTVVLSREKTLSAPVEKNLLETFAGEPETLLTNLAERGYSAAAICGGASVYTQFMQKGLIDRLFITVEPIVFGDGVRLFNQPFDNLRLQLVATHPLSAQTVVLEYHVIKP